LTFQKNINQLTVKSTSKIITTKSSLPSDTVCQADYVAQSNKDTH